MYYVILILTNIYSIIRCYRYYKHCLDLVNINTKQKIMIRELMNELERNTYDISNK